MLAYRESGIVEQVLVFDGDGCGWTAHDSPDKAHGSRRSLEEAERYPLAHPNCRRALGPVVSETPQAQPRQPQQPCPPPSLPPQPGQPPQSPSPRPLSARQLARLVRQTENQIVNVSHEEAYAWASDGRQLLHKVGQQFAVMFTNAEIASLRGHGTIFTHNHPRGWSYAASDPRHRRNSFSLDDILFAVDADLAEMRAVSPGWRHSMRPGPGGWPGQQQIIMAYNQADATVRARLSAEVAALLITAEQYEAEYFHEVWKLVSNQLGWRYRRARRS